MGKVTAPVCSSVGCPAWIARVANSKFFSSVISGSCSKERPAYSFARIGTSKISIWICVVNEASVSGPEPDQPRDRVVVRHDGESAVREEPGEADDPEAQEHEDRRRADLVGGQLRRLAADDLDHLVDPEEDEVAQQERPDRVELEGLAELSVRGVPERAGDAAAGAGEAEDQREGAEDGPLLAIGKIKEARCQQGRQRASPKNYAPGFR